jgi:hypothetical protein
MTDEIESVIQSPVVNNVAVGLKDGTIMMFYSRSSKEKAAF